MTFNAKTKRYRVVMSISIESNATFKRKISKRFSKIIDRTNETKTTITISNEFIFAHFNKKSKSNENQNSINEEILTSIITTLTISQKDINRFLNVIFTQKSQKTKSANSQREL